ncbi:hypothetical protein ICN32_11455 [Polynucleobacter wuianus]|uniref:hypothetical protein n=1 Tax=Polynucleobacter wuianus TaxID=1743168 RepID=UPI001C0DDB20|nr:hypothetical protein [Polynucleobacter wuianus]MBU3611169.1 hypothetical protein [Polynucleobacter wuianus]
MKINRSKSDKAWATLLFLALIFFLYCSISTINFGNHWDEMRIINSVRDSVETGILLPRWYNYPSFSYLVGLLASLPYLIFKNLDKLSNLIYSTTDIKLLMMALGKESAYLILENNFKLVLRVIFITLSSLTAIFTFLSLREMKLSVPSRVIGSLVILSSFQFFYHSRWIAPDVLLVSASAMLILSCINSQNKKNLLSLRISAVCAGLCIAIKYQAGILLILPLCTGSNVPFKTKLVNTIFFSTATFVVITPGAVIEPIHFIINIIYEIRHYSVDGHGVNTIQKGGEHLLRILDFIFIRLFSKNIIISILLSLFCVSGFILSLINIKYKIYRKIICIFPIVYIFYFSSQSVMNIRNYLVILPFFALYVAIFFDYLSISIKSFFIKLIISLFFILIFSINLYSIYNVLNSFNYVETNLWKKEVEKYVLINKLKPYITPKVKDLLGIGSGNDSIVSHSLTEADSVIYLLGEYPEMGHWAGYKKEPYLGNLANYRGIYKVIAGPDDVDLDYYPTWDGLDRIVVVTNPYMSLLTSKKREHD